jgi:hypothetical protein
MCEACCWHWDDDGIDRCCECGRPEPTQTLDLITRLSEEIGLYDEVR